MSKNFKLFLIFTLIAVFLAGSISLITKKLIKELPSITKLETYTPNLITKLYDINGKVIDEFFIERRSLVPLSQIPPHLKNAIIAIEDDRFYKHWGISPVGIMRAAISNLAAGKVVQGGSTITQQLAKSIFLTRERTMKRKIKEALLSLLLERNYSKNEILQIYLNQIYFGNGAYGIASAAKTYFNKTVDQLNLEECALLAGLPKAPSYYSPFKNSSACLSRRNIVLKRMKDMKFISAREARLAQLAPLSVIERFEKKRQAPYFIEFIRQKLEKKYGDLVYKGGLKIYTSLDLKMQKAAEKVLEARLAQFDINKSSKILNNLSSYTTSYTTHDIKTIDDLLEKTTFFNKVQGALIAIDPHTGQIRALVGGRDFTESQFNRVIQAKRQPGSVFKPFIYTAAIDNGWTPTSILNDSPAIYYNDGNDWALIGRTTDFSDIPIELQSVIDFEDKMKIWAPKNYTNRYRGLITLRTALEKSINLCSIELLRNIGPSTAAYYAKKMGIKSKISPYLSMALGSFVVTPIEITNAFATIANQGIKTKPYAVIKIYDNQNQLLEENFPAEKEVISAQTAYIIANLLKGVVQRGTGGHARRLKRTAAGKTGTTNKYSDAWFIGFTPQLVAGVWVGYDNVSTLGDKMAGGVIACPIWTDFMKKALRNKPHLEFPVPPNIQFLQIDRDTGLLALNEAKNTYIEAFIKGSAPRKFSIVKTLDNEPVIDSKEKLLVNKKIITLMDELIIPTTGQNNINFSTSTTQSLTLSSYTTTNVQKTEN